MIDDIRFPTVELLKSLHERQIEYFGGSPGIRDEGALEAAIVRARQFLAYESEKQVTLFELAAAVGTSICRHRHPFVDGNKRMGFMVIALMLELNGHVLDVAEMDAAEKMERLAAGEISEQTLSNWIAGNSYRAKDSDRV